MIDEFDMFAAILGFHGMLNQVQYHQAFVENAQMKDTAGGFSGMSCHLLNLSMFETSLRVLTSMLCSV